MFKKFGLYAAVLLLSFSFTVYHAIPFFSPASTVLTQTLYEELNNPESDYRSQSMYQNNQLVYYEQNRFIPPLSISVSKDSILAFQGQVYYVKSTIKGTKTQLSTLNLSACFNDNNQSLLQVFLTPCSDCAALNMANSTIYLNKKERIPHDFYLSFALLILSAIALGLKLHQKIGYGLVIVGTVIGFPFLWILAENLALTSSYLSFSYPAMGVQHFFQWMLLALALYIFYQLFNRFMYRYKTAVRLAFVFGLSVYLGIYASESFAFWAELNEPNAFLHFAWFSIVASVLLYHVQRLWLNTLLPYKLALGTLIGLLTILSVYGAATLALLILLKYTHKNRRIQYLFMAIGISISLSVFTEIDQNKSYSLKQNAFVNGLVDRERILQAYDFPEIIKEARELKKVYDLDFEQVFATLFQNEYLGYYEYQSVATDNVIVKKTYTPYGLGYFTVFEQSKAPLEPSAYAFYINDKLVEEQPLGRFPKAIGTQQIQNYQQFSIDAFTVLLPYKSIDYLKLFSRATLLFLLIYGLGSLPYRPRFRNSIRSNISSAILLFSLAILSLWAGISYSYLTQSEKGNITQNILEKSQSVQIELAHKIQNRQLKLVSSPELNAILRKFSTVFFTDINVYKVSGKLLASSRPQVYQAGLLSERINPLALGHFTKSSRPLVSNETLNGVNFLSAYALIEFNGESYILHLPQFNRNQNLDVRIEKLTEVFINLLLLVFLLASTISIFLSYSISQPLLKLSNSIASLSIEETNNQAQVPPQKELKALSLAYNKKVRELEASVAKLTETEREKTWRSLARQVAHEIKNPLTPIKLSAQFFERQLENGPVDQEKFKTFLSALQEQVNSLSRVASDFNDLASFNQPQPEKVNILQCIENLNVYLAHKDIIKINGNADVYMDKSHFTRVFNNLCSNAIEAMENQNEKQIWVDIKRDGGSVEMHFSDSGPGIAEEHAADIFNQSFSTKKTGMGLGLYMVRTLMRQNKGQIDLMSSQVGACFKLRFLASEK